MPCRRIFYMLQPYIPRKMELPRKTDLCPIKSLNGLFYPRVELEQRSLSGDEIGSSVNFIENLLERQPRKPAFMIKRICVTKMKRIL